MTTRFNQPSPRPVSAALPPGLQPHAVLALAPPTDRLRSTALCAAVYALLAGGVAWVAHAGVVAALPKSIDDHRVVIYNPNPAPAQPRTTVSSKTPEMPALPHPPVVNQVIPDHPTMPTRVECGLPPAQFVPPTVATAVGDPAPSGPISVSMDALRVIHEVDPVYPPLAKMARVQGQVVVRMTIDEHGVPYRTEAVSGPAPFLAAAVQAARQWRFQPATQDGQPVPATFLLQLNFVLR